MQCKGLLKNEYTKFQETHDKFCKDKAAHMQNFKGKKEKTTLPELEKTFSEKIANAEESPKKMKQDDKLIHIHRKTIGSFLGDNADDRFRQDDD
ncbi:hypothetical protein PVAP13_1KG086200 [Panicum virgatum]|uniref:Uncharacterized protein n=1 Tax=Panicum virgatum TaxID=38727 RepID=A0A8T0X3Y0_PANVG|nr:hypothetical protein PVAP13_1KG086200 [Panicum virgatum]